MKIDQPSLYARLLDTVKPINAMLSVKGGRPLVNHFLRIVSLIGLDKSLGLVKVIIGFLAFCFKYIKTSSVKGLVIYLKACTVILQQASGGHKLKSMNGLGIRFARSGSGYPRIIPILHRGRIHEPKIFRLWMTLFSVYRVLEMPGKLKLHTITNPSLMSKSIVPEFMDALEVTFWPALSSLPGFDLTKVGEHWGEPLDFVRSLRAVPFLISKASSASGIIRLEDSDPKGVLSTSPASILASVKAWVDNPSMFPLFKEWCKLTSNQWLINRIETWNKILIPMVDPADTERAAFFKGMSPVLGRVYARSLGRLGFKEEAAGKVRVFAYVDPFTQWTLKPLHDAIFELLALIPQDGTRDQMRPIKLLLEKFPKGPFFSFDLSAATDRLPVVTQILILAKFMTLKVADLWAELLTRRVYYYRYKPGRGPVQTGAVRYRTGQPMGALSSWAMLALTHHAIVQMAALNAGVIRPGEWFTGYAVLGDDIVIANAAVADEYQRLMQALGVEIGLAKSLISISGQTLEFAKRTIHRGVDVSPVPFSEYWVGRQALSASLELVAKYRLTLAQYLSFMGFGYKAKGSVTGNLVGLGNRLRHRVLAYFSPFASNPLTMANWFAMKGLNRYYSWTERKLSDFTSMFVKTECQRILDRLDSESMKKMWDFVYTLSTLNKDREYYGTLSRNKPGARKIDLEGLNPFASTRPWSIDSPAVRYVDINLFYFVVDDIVQTVYREVFLDVRTEVRELRYAIEDAIKAKEGPTLNDLDKVVSMYYHFQETLSNIPLPKEIFYRVESEARISNLELIKQWEVYSRFLRSTIST
jgi:hypothetical protein